MKNLLRVIVCFTVVAAMVGTVLAETETNITGQIRLRDEFDKRQFDPDNSHTQTFSELRTRVTLEALVDDNAHAVVQFQDSRLIGGRNSFGEFQSGTLNDDEGFGVHQAYIKVDRIAVDGLGAMGGRFELSLGNERVFGAVGWDNVGRAWEGGMAWYKYENIKFLGFGLKAAERNDPFDNQDFDIFGGQFSLNQEEWKWDVFSFFEFNADTTNLFFGIRRLERLNIGTYYFRQYQNFDFTGNFNYQAGKIPGIGALPPIEDELDIAAFMFTAEGGLSLEGGANARIAAGIDYSSGDDDPLDEDFNTYVNAYYTSHKFRGYMDRFVESEPEGLIDYMLRGHFDPYEKWTVAIDAHLFQTAKDYTDFLNEETKDVGTEIDAIVTTSVVDGIMFTGGGSIFFPTESFAGDEDPDPGLWFYTMTTLTF